MKRLFRLTQSEYYADFFITPPVTIVLAVLSLYAGVSIAWFLLFAAGLFIWTLYEYIVHRWISHEMWPFTIIHQWHHDKQKDYIALHPLLTVSFYALLWVTFGVQSSALMVGFSFGYIFYSIAHTWFHYGPTRFLKKLKRHHALHHTFHNVNFGVSTTFWDRILGTKWHPGSSS